jgi:hypothetical protein
VALAGVLALCPPGIRILAWVKPYAPPYVRLIYSWEPVILQGGRPIVKPQPHVRDVCIDNGHQGWAAQGWVGDGLVGAKPKRFCHWVLSALNVQAGDQLDDLYPGTGAMSVAAEFRGVKVRPYVRDGTAPDDATWGDQLPLWVTA